MKKFILTLMLLVPVMACAAEKTHSLSSPDGKLSIEISTGNLLQYTVTRGDRTVIAKSPISVSLADGTIWGAGGKLQKVSRRRIDRTIASPVYKRSQIADLCNEMTMNFKGYRLIVRAYDEAVAYRFQSAGNADFTVKDEQATFRFPEDWTFTSSYVNEGEGKTFEQQFTSSFENIYSSARLSGWKKGLLSFLPTLVQSPDGLNVCIMESDLFEYPGMYLYNPSSATTLQGMFATVPDKVHQGGHNMLQGRVDTRHDYIATLEGGASLPWRIVMVADNDAALADADIVYKLARDPEGDFSWVRPGKVAWDWWNDWNIRGVDFRSGVNNDTYFYYIDFAASKGIEYVILDEGWSVQGAADLMTVVPEIDLEKIIAYAAKKNVGIILWAGYWALNRDIDGLCKHFADMGVKGFKVDFMDRDDATMVKFYGDVAATAAKYHLLIDFHGAFKPIGLHRTYPNVLNHEGVNGLEQMKWRPKTYDQITYDVTIPFIRMAAGPLDYTQGAMRNGGKSNYRPNYSEPMSQGSRCHQMAMYTIFESPLNMLCDSPSNYMEEPLCTDFIAAIPTVWDETRVLGGTVGQWVAIARRSGDTWYVGALNGTKPRSVELDLSFIDGERTMDIFADGANADRNGNDFRHNTTEPAKPGKITVDMAFGGGWTARIK